MNQRRKVTKKSEMTSVRRSLSTLGFILRELGRGVPTRGLPFKDSVLTWLLKDTFSGNYHASFISTVSPSNTCYEETLSTLKFARRLLKDKKEKRISTKKKEMANMEEDLPCRRK